MTDKEPGAATRSVTFTRYDNVTDNLPKPETRPWLGTGGWVEVLSAHEHRGTPEDSSNPDALDAAKNGPCIILGEMAVGTSRGNSSVQAIHALGLDLDSISDDDLAAVVKQIDRWEWVAYTTHRHAAECAGPGAKVRIVLPLANPIGPEEHKAAWRALDKLTGHRTDRKTKNAARVFFLPSTFDPEVAWAVRNEGPWLDHRELIDLATPPKIERNPTSGDAAELLRLLREGRPGRDEEGNDLAAAARAVANGQPFAPKGKRHEVILGLTLWIARKSKDAPFSDDAIAEVFGPSYAATAIRDGESPGTDDAINAYQGALEKVAEWDTENSEAKTKSALASQLARVGLGEGGAYSDEELRQIAETAKIPHDGRSVTEALRRRWIIQAADSAFYILGGDGAYRGPFGPGMGRSAAVEILARAPVLLNEPGRNGYRRRSIQELTEDYGMCAVEILVDLTRQRTYFDERSRRVYEAARPLRDVEPRFDPEIDAWLKVLAGPQYGKICDWLACAPDLDKLLCAIYIAGHPGAGKTLLAHGVARLWSDTPGDLEKAMADFNDEIVRCPMLIADEVLPKHWKGASVTTKLRSMLSTLERTLSRKYLPSATLKGAIRLIITANNEFLLHTKDAVSGQDLEAVAQRFLYIDAPEAARNYVESMSVATKRRWQEGGIAAHALWLHQNREVKPGRRFWVEGDPSQMHRLLLVSSEWASKVCEWLVRYLMNPKPYKQRNDGLIREGAGQLFVNEQAIIDGWSVYFPETHIEPDTAKIGAAIRAISGRNRPHMRWHGKRYRYREILTDLVFGWSDAHGIGDRQTMVKTLWDGVTPPREAGEDDDRDENATDDLASVLTLNSEEDPF